MLESAMTGAGHVRGTGTGIAFDLPTLLTFGGIFLAGDMVDNSVLISYVEAGGNVYLASGSSVSAQAEANNWNQLLNYFGLEFVVSFNGITEASTINSPHPIFSGVKYLFYNNGSDIIDLDPGDTRGQILISSSGHNLYAAYQPALVPESSMFALVAFGLVGTGELYCERDITRLGKNRARPCVLSIRA